MGRVCRYRGSSHIPPVGDGAARPRGWRGLRTEQPGNNEPSLIVANSSREVEENLRYRPQAHCAEPHAPTVLRQFEECPFRHFEISACGLLCMNDAAALAAQRISIGMRLVQVSMFTIDFRRTPEQKKPAHMDECEPVKGPNVQGGGWRRFGAGKTVATSSGARYRVGSGDTRRIAAQHRSRLASRRSAARRRSLRR